MWGLAVDMSYHHSRVSLGVLGIALALLLPYSVNWGIRGKVNAIPG